MFDEWSFALLVVAAIWLAFLGWTGYGAVTGTLPDIQDRNPVAHCAKHGQKVLSVSQETGTFYCTDGRKWNLRIDVSKGNR